MVTCTTPPFRAAVRLNSGVRPHGKTWVRTIKAVAFAALLLSPVLAHAKDYCPDADSEKNIQCWNRLIDQKEDALERAIAASKNQARVNGKSYGLDIPETLRLIEKSQRAWEEYAAQECAVQREAIGSGTDRNPQEMNCHLAKLDSRILEIQQKWPQ